MDSEVHYVTYDPEKIFEEMQLAYLEAGGNVLYPGDEKEMLLRSVQSVIVQTLAGVDHALRMATLRYAAGEYLDLYGEKRGCARIEAQAAQATVEIQFRAGQTAKTIAAGTALTADGERVYALTEDVLQTGAAQTVRAGIRAESLGVSGNALAAGTRMQFLISQNDIISVTCVTDATGGTAREDDDTYRERIRSYGLVNVTTGPQIQYEAQAKAVSSEILDARATNGGAGKVNVTLLTADTANLENLKAAVASALNALRVRPLTDQVTVGVSAAVEYTLAVKYKAPAQQNVASGVAAAVADYQKWQDNTIGRAFNPDRLMAAIYQAGAERVSWGTGSNFNGGDVEYTEIGATAHCAGTITIEVMT